MNIVLIDDFGIDSKVRRVITMEELKSNKYYSDLCPIARIFNHAAIETTERIWRWNYNDAIQWIDQGAIDFNGLWIALCEGKVKLVDHMKFYMQIGYSLTGFLEIYTQHEANEIQGLKAIGNENLLDFVQRVIGKDQLLI